MWSISRFRRVAQLREITRSRKQSSVFDCHLNFLCRRPFHQSSQQLAADLRQKRLSENGVHHPAAALELGTAAHNQVDHRIIIAESNFAILADSLLDPAELEPDNGL